jgi:hypothetical protein
MFHQVFECTELYTCNNREHVVIEESVDFSFKLRMTDHISYYPPSAQVILISFVAIQHDIAREIARYYSVLFDD